MIPTIPTPHEVGPDNALQSYESEIVKARTSLEDISRAILKARSTFSQGTLPSLAHIEDMIRTVCVEINSVPRDKAVSLRDRFEALFYDLDALETDMRSRFGDLALRSKDLPKASEVQTETIGSAYRRTQERHPQLELEENVPASS